MKPWQEFVVYLAGPLPGIIVGGFCAIAGVLFDTPPIVGEIGLWALVINYLNMLPFVPFDGGRMIESAVLVRYPRARFLFSALSVCFLGLAYMAVGDAAFLVLALLFAAALPAEWRYAKAARALSAMRDSLVDARERLHAIFGVIASGTFSNLALPARMHLARRLDQQFSVACPTNTFSILGLVMYVAVWVAPLVGVAGAGFGAGLIAAFSQRQDLVVAPTADWDRAIAAAHDAVIVARTGDRDGHFEQETAAIRHLAGCLAGAGLMEESEDVLLGHLETLSTATNAHTDRDMASICVDLGRLSLKSRQPERASEYFQAAADHRLATRIGPPLAKM